MPTTRTAEKELRVAQRRKARNKSVRSHTKTEIRKAEEAIFSGKLEVAEQKVKAAVSALDKEAEKGIAHPNKTARRKSRLLKKLNQAIASSKKGSSKSQQKEG